MSSYGNTTRLNLGRTNQSRGGPYLANFGGKVSGEWLLPKAAQMAEEAPGLWSRASRFIELGDWIVWRLTGRETRSTDFAAYKAQYSITDGYPKDVVPGPIDKLAPPVDVGRSAGKLRRAGGNAAGFRRTRRRRGGHRFPCHDACGWSY